MTDTDVLIEIDKTISAEHREGLIDENVTIDTIAAIERAIRDLAYSEDELTPENVAHWCRNAIWDHEDEGGRGTELDEQRVVFEVCMHCDMSNNKTEEAMRCN